MHELPADIRDSDVAAALARHWEITVRDLSYLPVGFGGYHWLAVDRRDSRWFVTVSDLAAPWVPDLPAAMRTAVWLAIEAGLEFVVAPVPTRAGQVVGLVDSRRALTLFPYADVVPCRFQDPVGDDDRAGHRHAGQAAYRDPQGHSGRGRAGSPSSPRRVRGQI